MVFNWFRRQFSDKNQPEEKPKQPDPTPEAPEEEKSEASADEYLKWAKAAYQNIQKGQATTTASPEPAEAETVAPEEESTEEQMQSSADESVIESRELETNPVIAETPAITESVTVTEVPDEPTVVESVESIIQTEAVEASSSEAIAEIETSIKTEGETPVLIEETEAAKIPSPEATSQVETPVETIQPEAAKTEVENPVETIQSETPETEIETKAEVKTETKVEAEIEAETEATPLPFWAKAEAERQERLKQLAETAVDTPVEEDFTKPATTKAKTPEMEFDEEFLWSAEVLARQGRRPEEVSIEEINWLQKLRQGLDKTRLGLINQLKAIVGAGPLNREAVMEIEAALLQADVGIDATDYIIEALQNKLREEALPPKEAIAYLKKILRDILDAPTKDSDSGMLFPEKDRLNIWLISGVNGAGKTTTIGKLAHLAQKSGYKALIAAADTFRAAAVEQVTVWGERSGVEVIANPGKNTDPAAVVFDAIAAAQSRGTELLLVDTAGRLQNKKNLMEELSKIRRIIEKKAPNTIVESLIVLDATLGQNGLRQAQVFSDAINLSGAILTKLDGTAKGGIAMAVSQQMGLPIRFIGAGEGIDDLRPFSSYEFVEAMLNG